MALERPVAAAAYGVLDQAARFRASVKGVQGRRGALVLFAAGALSNLALAPFFIWPVMFLTLPVLVWSIDGVNARSAARAAWWFGFGYFFFGLFWIGEAFLVEADKFGWALPFAVTLMPAGLALFWALAGGIASLIWRPGVQRVLVLAMALAGAEWLRGHVLTGFPWNAIGYTLTAPPVLMQSAGLLGIYALSLWAVLIFAGPLVVIADAEPGSSRRRAALLGGALAAVPLGLLAAYGLVRLSVPAGPMVEGVKLRIVQPSVPQREKWKPENQGAIFRDHLDLSQRNAAGLFDGLADTTHLIWPEAAMPFLPLEHPEALDLIGQTLPDGVQLLSGGLRREPVRGGTGWRAYNGLMVFDDRGALTDVYDKTHLVPFGEYLPQQEFLEAIGLEQLTRLRGGFTPGATPRPLIRVRGLPEVAGLICYEAIFPGVGAAAEKRPSLFINVTNDGWFGNTTGPRQHFHQARVRAVEEGVPFVRAANNGISAVIDGTGRVLARLDLNERGVIDAGVPAPATPPLIILLGDWMLVANTVLFALISVLFMLRGRVRPF